MFRERLIVQNNGKAEGSEETKNPGGGLMYPTVCVEEEDVLDQQVGHRPGLPVLPVTVGHLCFDHQRGSGDFFL